ncbi:TspB protein [Ralstonia mannitolilytica]
MHAFFVLLPARSWIALRRALALLALALACGPTLAFSATDSGSTGHVWKSAGYTGVSAVAACSAYVSVAYPGMVIDGYNSATGFCTGHWPSDPNQCGGSCNIGVVELSDCVVGYEKQPDGTCKKPTPNCPAAGQPPSGGNTANGTSPTQTILNPQVCVGGCTYTYSSYWTGAKPGQSGGYPAQYTGLQSTGNACDGSATPTASMPAPPTPDNPCGQRQYYGTVNGQPKCVDYPTQTTGGTTSTTTTDAPASSPAASSSSTTTTSTTCDGATCTTTTVVVGGGGGVGGGPGGNGSASGASASPCATGQVSTGAQVNGGPGTCTTTTTQPQDEYCKEHPTAEQCGNKSQWGGDCTAGFTCKGDAVVCAISQVQYKQYCEAQQLAHAQIGKAFFGNDPLGPPDDDAAAAEIKALNPQDKTTGKGENDIDVGAKWQAALNDVSKKLTVFGGASCPAGNTITFMGITVVVPYDIMCQFATVVRGFVTLAAAMVCLRIFGRSD